MHWFSIIGIGIAANLDNLGIGLSFGARSTRVPLISNFVIAILSMIASYTSIALGDVISQYIPGEITNWGGGAFLVIIGLFAIKADLKNSSNQHRQNGITSLLHSPNKADRDGDKVISWRESLTLGIALALNCAVGGFGAGMTGLSPVMTTISIGIFSLLTIHIGVRAGQQLARTWLGKWFNRIGGIFIVLIGLYEVFV
ncbi:sporulation membrane protein YtaF [Paenibacillus marchantiophytorum]|uniref:Sporulation membrane protein YtaF n=1 Tax=Paenibacillus marchantiophytorum TaxID=1619310 RepID=A0ABQ1EXB2_9BACL|nr:manganese efflux pump [Paenibacillus marchantiophytorum]GFZ91684.1 sporulation membrane protein YtaF [Paenibacillus marchantiophytorum]